MVYFFVVVIIVDVLFFLDFYNPIKTCPGNLKAIFYTNGTLSTQTVLSSSPSLMAIMAHTQVHTWSL